MKKKFDTGTFFKKNKTEKQQKTAPASAAYAPTIHAWEIHVISLTINSEGYINLS